MTAPSRAGYAGDKPVFEDTWNARALSASLVAPGSRVLDVGCGWGTVAEMLHRKGCRVVGVEPDPERRQVAAQHCDQLLDGTAEGLGSLGLAPASFDAVLFTDVLEHLVDPWGTLKASLDYLKPDGRVVISIPNVANFGARWNLAKGQFRYQDFGLYDRTHLRFFTRDTLVELVGSAGLEVVQWRYAANLTETQAFKRTFGRIPPLHQAGRRCDRWLTHRFNRLFAVQFVIACERV